MYSFLCHNYLFIPPLLPSYWMSSGCSVQTICSRTLSLRKLPVKCEEWGWSAGIANLLIPLEKLICIVTCALLERLRKLH